VIFIKTPEHEAIKYLINQPTTTEYPIAIPKDPTTGMQPIIFPPFIFRCLKLLTKAPYGPDFIDLPNAISPAIPEIPSRATKKMYGIRNAAPPNSPARYGNNQIFPIPTAEPIQANINPIFDLNPSLFFSILFLFLIKQFFQKTTSI